MTDKSTVHLRLHVEPLPGEAPTLPLAELWPLFSAFERATGWLLRFEQSPPGIGEAWSMALDGLNQPGGRLVLVPPAPVTKGSAAGAATIELPEARALAMGIAGLVNEIHRLKQAVWQREAELAAGVPLAARPGDEPHLAERLEAVLRSGAEAIGCQAAGLYLLDEFTTELKLRAVYGLPPERLLAPPRPLRGAVADLEALVGHAVVLEDASLLPHWRCPEPFASAVCVPVSSLSIPLGTLWLFCDQQRDFTPAETNLLEIIAGRLAADLEREMLLAAGVKSKRRDKQLDAAAQWQADRLPSIVPLLDEYDVAGWTERADEIGGGFYDWSVLNDGRLLLTAGHSAGQPLEAALGTAALQMALRAHAAHRPGTAPQLLSQINESIVATSAGDQRASLACALLTPGAGQLELARAGNTLAVLIGHQSRLLTRPNSPLVGASNDASYAAEEVALAPGESVVLISGNNRQTSLAANELMSEAAITRATNKRRRDTAAGLAQRLRETLLQDHGEMDDLSLLVLHRRRRSHPAAAQ